MIAQLASNDFCTQGTPRTGDLSTYLFHRMSAIKGGTDLALPPQEV